MNKNILLFLSTLCIFSADFVFSADLDRSFNSASVYGGVGLIQNPSARFDQDGEFGFGTSTEVPFKRLYAKMQFFPWLETVVRYTEGEHRRYSDGSIQSWKDKGMDIKLKLLEESDILPQIALGFTDFGGTGAFSSEFLVANKRINNIDYTLGIGWGRLAGTEHFTNPAAWVSESYRKRGGSDFYGGTVKLGGLFTGPYTSIFGGLEYFTPIPNLSFKVEYDTADYTVDIGLPKRIDDENIENFEVESRINYALTYQRSMSTRDKLDLSVGFIRGNTLYANLTLHSNLNNAGNPKTVMAAEILKEATIEPYNSLTDDYKKYVRDIIIWEMSRQGFVTHNINFFDKELQVEISQSRFQNPLYAIDLASRLLANNSPKNIEMITVINIDMGVETLRGSIPRDRLVDAVSKGGVPEEYISFNQKDPLGVEEPIVISNDTLYPNFHWNIRPHANGTLQHQEEFYFYGLEALFHSEYSFSKGFYFSTDIGIDIANNFDNYSYHIPDGELYNVRQDRRLYLTEGKTGIRRMQLDYVVGINHDLTAKFTGGILEWMYGGFGAELLYMPDNKPWAIGIDTFWVKQRDYDQKFSFKDYETVTGFTTIYYDLPIYDLTLKVSGGRFLGKDKGAIIDVSRRFKTGAMIGAKVALTDCDPDCVGEGSFNKWIYFDLPMDLFFVNSTTRGRSHFEWSPLTKNAGQKVQAGSLYPLMKSAPREIDSLRRTPWSIKKIFSGFGTSPKSNL